MKRWLAVAKPVLDILPNGVVVTDTQETIQYINPVLEKITYQSTGKLLGCQIEELFETLPNVNNKDQYLPDDVLNNKNVLFDWTAIISDKQLVGRIGIFINIPGFEVLKQELEHVKQLNRELEAIFNASYDEIFVTDGAGVCLRVNKACERLYGLPPEQLINRNVVELGEEGVCSSPVAPYVLREKKLVTITQQTQSGRTIAVSANPVFNDLGEITRIVINCRDLTELVKLQERLEKVEKEAERSKQEVEELRKTKNRIEGIVFCSKKMLEIIEVSSKVAGTEVNILILGESGVGKDLLAKFIHNESKRRNGPFININCGAIPQSLLESELFGYERGAFTGARREGKNGIFELANGGTLLLNEIGELPINVQVKLLQVLQDRQVLRIGGTKPINIDVRLIAATNCNLEKMVKEGLFREDLYYRLNVVPITIPPLRERKEDIPHLINFYLNKFNQQHGYKKSLSPDTINYLIEYCWPGNIRELQNLIERIVVTGKGQEIQSDILPPAIKHGQKRMEIGPNIPLKDALENLEKQILADSFFRLNNTYRMADALGISQPSIIRKLKKYKIGKK